MDEESQMHKRIVKEDLSDYFERQKMYRLQERAGDTRELRQLGVDEIARHHRLLEADQVLLGRIMTLNDHPSVLSFRMTTSYDGSPNFGDYELLVSCHLKQEELMGILNSAGFPAAVDISGSWEAMDSLRFAYGAPAKRAYFVRFKKSGI